MSKLSYLEKLLDGVEVEWKALWEVTVWDKKFNAVDRHKQKKINKHHYFLAKEINELVVSNGTVKLLTTNVSNKYTSEELAGDKIKSGEIIAIPWGGDAIVQYYKGKYLTSDNRIATSSDPDLLSNKYLYYFLLNNLNELSSYYRGSGIKHPSMYDVLEMKIPIPSPNNPEKSLAIQAEIVRILDAFTAMTAELTAELNMRKKQYNYYRDQLLSFEEGDVEWKTLGEVTTITIGEFVRKDIQDATAKYPVFNGGREATGYYERYNNSGNKVIVSARGANAGFVNRLSTPYWAGNSCYSIGVTNEKHLNWNYVYYYLKKSESILIGIQQKGGIPAVSKKQMEDFLLPIPHIVEQERIVTILEKFDALTNSLSDGLPREIELRQKQYEYYRDLLLSFPKSHSDEAA